MAATGGTIPEHDDPAHSAHYKAEEHDRVLMNHMAEPFVRWANWAAHEAIAGGGLWTQSAMGSG